MLPFLKPKQAGSVIQTKRMSDGEMKVEGEEGKHSPGAMSAAEDMISAVHAKDATAVADAMRAHHDMMMSEIGEDDAFSMDDD